MKEIIARRENAGKGKKMRKKKNRGMDILIKIDVAPTQRRYIFLVMRRLKQLRNLYPEYNFKVEITCG